MKIDRLTVGPILGFVNSHRARIFGRGNKIKSGKSESEFIVSRIRQKEEKEFEKHIFLKLNSNLDFTAVIQFDELLPDTEYEYQFICVSISNEMAANILSVQNRFR
jgi:hypothetical protein